MARVFLVIAAVLAMMIPDPASADSPVIPSVESILADAGFVGIVQCETAGGIVAKYRVVESWKGPPVGSRLLIGQYANTWEPQYPLALVGEQYLVAAQSYRGEWSLASPVSLMSATPLWWRRIRPQYFALWPAVKLPAPEQPTGGLLQWARNGRGATLDTFRVDVARFLDRDERHLELEALRAEARWSGTRHAMREGRAEPCTTATCGIVASDSLELVVASLIRASRSRHGFSGGPIFYAGREECLRQLEALPDTQTVFNPKMLGVIKKQIRCRLGMELAEPEPDRFAALPYADSTRDRLVHCLTSYDGKRGSGAPQFYEAFQRLTDRDPNAVASFLKTWEPPRRMWADSGMAYEFASYFAHRCGRDRPRLLKQLLKARDPMVRVAGAVYLCFEDEAEGVKELKSLMSLPGDAGAWAAMTLARRGDKGSMPRALEVLADRGASEMAGVPHKNFQKRLIELLSNSAAASGLKLPLDWKPGESEYDGGLSVYVPYRRWWEDHRDRIRLSDPWFQELAARKID